VTGIRKTFRQINFRISTSAQECTLEGDIQIGNSHIRIVSIPGVVLLLCLLPPLRAENQGSLHDRDSASPSQTQAANSPTRHTGCQSQGEPDKVTGERPCIVDLKPGDARLFAPSKSTAGRLRRWLDLQAASVGIQYLFAENGLDVTTANQQQYQVAVRGRFKFDADGRFTINAGLYSGSNFIAGSDNTGLGAGKAQSNLYLKHLYLNALPIHGVEVQYGGLDIWHDESTDITGYAYNGYVVGERVSIKRPRDLFFDDISIAYAHAGDLSTPNVFRRLHRLTQSNFHRFMLRKNIGERAWVSADYAFQSGVPTWREAVRVRTTELRVVDAFHAEIYEVSRLHSGYGLAAYSEKMVHPKFIVGGGYADIDRPMLNSDRYGRGKRLFVTIKIPVNKTLSVLAFTAQATDHATTNLPQQRIDIGLYYNLLHPLQKTGLF
jgi:hypothetical protein